MRMSSIEVKRIHIQIWMCGFFIVSHGALLIYVLTGIEFAFARPTSHLAIALFTILWAICIVIVSVWFLILFAVHVRSATLAESGGVIERVLGSHVKVCDLGFAKPRTIAVPSLTRPGYQRGVLFSAGASSCFVPDTLDRQGVLVDHLRHARDSRAAA
jgi:hypothetical protein